MHIRKVEQFNHVVEFYQTHQVFLAQSLQSVQSVFVCCNQYVDSLISILNLDELVRVNEFKQLLERWQVDVLHRDHRLLSLSHAYAEHVLKEVAPGSQDALVGLHLGVTHHECHVCKVLVLKHSQQILGHLRFWDLDSDRKHPNVVETQLTVVSAENVELSFHDVCRVSATRSGLELGGGDLLPVVGIDVKHVHVVHPVDTIVAAEVNDLRVDQAASSRYSGAGNVARNLRLHPGQGFSVQVENVV